MSSVPAVHQALTGSHCHCEERSDEAIPMTRPTTMGIASLRSQ